MVHQFAGQISYLTNLGIGAYSESTLVSASFGKGWAVAMSRLDRAVVVELWTLVSAQMARPHDKNQRRRRLPRQTRLLFCRWAWVSVS